MDRCSLRQLYLSLEVRIRPISTQTARGERENPKKYSPRAPGGPEYPQIQPKAGLLALKVKEHHSSLFFRQISEPIGTSF